MSQTIPTGNRADEIQIYDLHKSFGDLEVLKGISLTVHQGEVVCVIGPSGSGKSTLLRCVNVLEQPTSGRIFILNEEITDPDADVDRIRTKMGMVFQQFNLFPHLTALENCTIAQIRVLKKSPEEARRVALENLANLRADFDEYGPGGFYDAIAERSGAVAQRYLSLDQGMIMAALGNELKNDRVKSYVIRGPVRDAIRPLLAIEEFNAAG